MTNNPGNKLKPSPSAAGGTRAKPEAALSAIKAGAEDQTLALAFYSAARAEILQRLSMRETTFLAWITTAGLILGWGIQQPSTGASQVFILELVPTLALAFGFALYRHSIIIRKLGKHIQDDLNPYLNQSRYPDVSSLPHWDNSDVLKKSARGYLVIELLAFIVFLVGVPSVCVVYLIAEKHVRWYAPLLLLAELSTAILLGVGAYELVQTWRRRR
jgi:hypothetical protein